jgi:hypothetical protein
MTRATPPALSAASEKHLSGYASAALAGLGVLSGARVAEAQIVTTTDPDQMIIDSGSIYLFAGAGFAAYTGPALNMSFDNHSQSSDLFYSRRAGVQNLNELGGGSYFAKNLTKGSVITPGGNFMASGPFKIGRYSFSDGNQTNNGYFHGQTGYLGFKFTDPTNSAVTDYGWAEITESANQNTLTLVNAAYDIGGPIITGQVPEPGSLALLAGGAGCLAAWGLRSRHPPEKVNADAPAG